MLFGAVAESLYAKYTWLWGPGRAQDGVRSSGVFLLRQKRLGVTLAGALPASSADYHIL